MKKGLFFLVVLFTIINLSLFASAAVLHKNIPLNNEIESQASATLTMRETTLVSGKYSASLSLNVKNLLPETSHKYQVWLIDDESQYHLNLGMLETSKKGKGMFKYKTNDINLQLYDTILITQEEIMDNDPHPAMHILSGELPF